MSEYHEASTELLHKLVNEGITQELLDEAREHIGVSRIPKTVIDWDIIIFAPIKFAEQYRRNLPLKFGIFPKKSDKYIDHSDCISMSGKLKHRWELHSMSIDDLWKEARSHCRKANEILHDAGLPTIGVVKKTNDVANVYNYIKTSQQSIKEMYISNQRPFLHMGSVLGCLRAIEEKTHGLSSDPRAQRFECFVKEWT